MKTRIAIIYNEPHASRYDIVGEQKAVLGVLDAVKAVHCALLELSYEVYLAPLSLPYDLIREQIESLKVDLVFNLFEGFPDQPETEALIPEMLSELGIPYTGCPATALCLALDKARAKMTMRAAGIRTPAFQLLNPKTLNLFDLKYPCVVKPLSEDASHGLNEESVVSDFAALARQVTRICRIYGGEALVEEFIAGRELNVTVLGNSAITVLPISEIDYSLPPGMPKILTFAAKWEPDSLYFRETRVVCPAQIQPGDQKLAAETAIKVFTLIGCRGCARVDMRLDSEGQLHIIEVNPNPDISPGAGAARQAEAAGMTYLRFINRIVELGMSEN